MQTFLPSRSFAESALYLDDRRLGKQRVEAKQILLALGVPVGDNPPNPTSSWRGHPAVKMWRGHEIALVSYAMEVCCEWRRRGFKDNLFWEFWDAREHLHSIGADDSAPSWLGDQSVHASHRSNLLRKDASHYGRFGWSEPNDLEYHWPVRA